MWTLNLIIFLTITTYFYTLATDVRKNDGKQRRSSFRGDRTLQRHNGSVGSDSGDKRVRNAKDSARRLGEQTTFKTIKTRRVSVDAKFEQKFQDYYEGDGEGRILVRKQRRGMSLSSMMHRMLSKPIDTPEKLLEKRIDDMIGGFPPFNPEHYVVMKEANGEEKKDVKSGFSTVAFRRKIGGDGPIDVNVVVKQIDRSLMTDLTVFIDSLDQAVSEIKAIKHFQENEVLFISEYIGAFKDTKQNFYVVIKYFRGMDLFDVINAQREIGYSRCEQPFIVEAMAPIMVALWQIHELDYVYHDLKIENIIKEGDDPVSTTPGFTTRLIDFGLAEKLPEINNKIKLKNEGLEYRFKSNTFCGTPDTMAPEIADPELSSIHDEKVDLWSLGVVIDTLASGSGSQFAHNCEALGCEDKDHDEDELTIHNIVNLKIIFPRRGRLRAILRRLLVDIPEDRPSMRELMDDPYFNSVDWYKLIRRERKARGFKNPIEREFANLHDKARREWPPRQGPITEKDFGPRNISRSSTGEEKNDRARRDSMARVHTNKKIGTVGFDAVGSAKGHDNVFTSPDSSTPKKDVKKPSTRGVSSRGIAKTTSKAGSNTAKAMSKRQTKPAPAPSVKVSHAGGKVSTRGAGSGRSSSKRGNKA